MARLIDADKIVNGIALYMAENAYLNDTPLDALKMVANWIADAPTVDAVEVVRCEKCKHGIWDEENEMWKCVESAEYDDESGEWFGFYEYNKGDFFCAHGERRSNA